MFQMVNAQFNVFIHIKEGRKKAPNLVKKTTPIIFITNAKDARLGANILRLVFGVFRIMIGGCKFTKNKRNDKI